MSMWRYSNFYQ